MGRQFRHLFQPIPVSIGAGQNIAQATRGTGVPISPSCGQWVPHPPVLRVRFLTFLPPNPQIRAANYRVVSPCWFQYQNVFLSVQKHSTKLNNMVSGDAMSFGLYSLGFAIVIGGLIYAAYLLHMPAHWIAVGAVVLLGLGILTGVKATRQKDPVG